MGNTYGSNVCFSSVYKMFSAFLLAQVHFPPYLFEAFLYEPVDDSRSTAKVGNGVAVISLPKKTNKVWENLTITTRKSICQTLFHENITKIKPKCGRNAG